MSRRGNKRNKKGDYYRPNMWAALRDVIIAGMSKGQLLPLMGGLIVAFMIFRMPPEDISKIMFELVSLIKDWYYIGWILAILSLPGWYITNKGLRRSHYNEMKRISDEKKLLQEKLLQRKLESSNDS